PLRHAERQAGGAGCKFDWRGLRPVASARGAWRLTIDDGDLMLRGDQRAEDALGEAWRAEEGEAQSRGLS
ncbi:MAG: hypothetical protein ACREFQ_05970, partial [Stellaceae bacterium]